MVAVLASGPPTPAQAAGTADLTLSVSGPPSIQQTTAADFTVSYANAGPDTATNLTVALQVPTGLTIDLIQSSGFCTVAVGGQANAFIVFSGCTPDKSGQCDVTIQFRVYQPNGKLYASAPPMEVWQHKPAPAVRMLELSVQYLKVVIEPHDLLGKYVVSANVEDHVSGASLQLSSTFTATR